MKHRYLVEKRVTKRVERPHVFEGEVLSHLETVEEYKYFWADEQFDSMSDFWFMFSQDYFGRERSTLYKVFIRFFVDGDEYVEGIWQEAYSENSCCPQDHNAWWRELYYYKYRDWREQEELPEPIVQRALGMSRDKYRPHLLIKKSFIDKWDKLHADQQVMEQEFADMVEQVKKGVA